MAKRLNDFQIAVEAADRFRECAWMLNFLDEQGDTLNTGERAFRRRRWRALPRLIAELKQALETLECE